MKISNYFYVALVLFANSTYGQKSCLDAFFAKNPKDIHSKYSDLQEYKVELRWRNLDAISGNSINCNAVHATFKTGLDNGFVGWSNVSISQIKDLEEYASGGVAIPSLNDFSYKAVNTDFLKDDFYKNIQLEYRDLAKWLVSDAVQMQGWTSYIFDSLSFKKEFKPKLMRNFEVEFDNWVKFTSRYQKLVWSGITKYNDEVCATVRFESLYNPLEMNKPEMTLKGRSLYWGEIWISLEDKQVEFATMTEDVVIKLKLSSLPQEQLIDLQRVVVFEKVK